MKTPKLSAEQMKVFSTLTKDGKPHNPAIHKGFWGDVVIDRGTCFEHVDTVGQRLEVRAGPVFVGKGTHGKYGHPRPAVWIEYQVRYGEGRMLGPILMSSEIFNMMVRDIRKSLKQWRQYQRRRLQ